MDLLQHLISFDKWLFELINGGLSNPLFDFFLLLFREKLFWAPLYLFVISYAILNLGKRRWALILGLALSVAIGDLTSSRLIKKQVQRLRPCNDPEMVDHIVKRVDCGGGYSFTSSHATNHFAVAVFLIGILGLDRSWQKKALLAWAGSIAFAQVYVGVHYPMDVLVGALLGSLIGWGVFRMLKNTFTATSHQYP